MRLYEPRNHLSTPKQQAFLVKNDIFFPHKAVFLVYSAFFYISCQNCSNINLYCLQDINGAVEIL